MTIVEKSQLTAYTLKLNDDERQQLKMICALDKSIKYQYEFFDAAVNWALSNADSLLPIANSKQGGNRSYYLRDTAEEVEKLESKWDCNTTRALYTAAICYLKHREKDLALVFQESIAPSV